MQLAETYERSRIPLYLQVTSALRRRIESGQWRPGQQISTLEELEAEFQVARVTVRQAIEILEGEGLVQRRQGKGTFVVDEIKQRRLLKLEVEWASLIATISENAPQFITEPGPVPSPRIEPGDGRAAGDYQYLKSIQTKDGEPYALASVHVARHIHDRDPEAFQSRAALAVLSSFKDITVARAHQTLVISGADTVAANHLQIELNSPIAEAHCVVVDNEGVAIYVGEIIYRGDRIKLDIDLLS